MGRAHDIKDPQQIYPLLARTATPTPATWTTPCRAGIIVINVTAITASPSVVFTLKGVDPNDIEYDILASAAIVGTGTTVLRVSPDLTAAANTIAKDMLPQSLKLVPVHGDADSITYQVGFIGTM